MALLFLIVAVIAAVFGFGDVAAGATDIAKVLFYIFLAICAILLIAGAMTYRAIAGPGDSQRLIEPVHRRQAPHRSLLLRKQPRPMSVPLHFLVWTCTAG